MNPQEADANKTPQNDNVYLQGNCTWVMKNSMSKSNNSQIT